MIAKRLAAEHELEIMPISVVVRSVKSAARTDLHEIAKERLVPDMEPKRHLRLAAISAEMPFAYEDSE